jgi:hypothetical protein
MDVKAGAPLFYLVEDGVDGEGEAAVGEVASRNGAERVVSNMDNAYVTMAGSGLVFRVLPIVFNNVDHYALRVLRNS